MGSIDFGVQIEPQYGFTYQEIKETAETAEALGYESIWVSDHFFMTPETVDTNALECYTVLTALARDTARLRLGAMVASQSYRNPAYLAKVAASLDHISDGRLNFGIGAGWKQEEYRAYGYPFPKPATRIRQLNELIEVCRRMWTTPKASYSGKHYKVEEALCAPKPVQEPLPVWVGGTGNMTLKVAARHGDAVNFAWSHPPDFYRERYKVLDENCRKIGRDPRAIRRSAGLMIVMDETGEKVEARVQSLSQGMQPEYNRYLSRQLPNVTGTPDTIAELLAEYVNVGVDHFILRWQYRDELRSMKLFAEKVMNKL